MDASQEAIAIVDRDNQVIDSVPRWYMRKHNLIHRSTYIFVFNNINALFVQRRAATKDLYPGYWDLAAGGVVLANESYDDCARRELREELGITADLRSLFEFYSDAEASRSWGQVYHVDHNGPFVLQQEEIESGEFVALDRVLGGGMKPVTVDTLAALKIYLTRHPRV